MLLTHFDTLEQDQANERKSHSASQWGLLYKSFLVQCIHRNIREAAQSPSPATEEFQESDIALRLSRSGPTARGLAKLSLD